MTDTGGGGASSSTGGGTNAATEISLSEATLYDRQIRLWGVKAQNQLKNSRTLCVGLNALGAELCKNIVLGGLNVSVMDAQPVTLRDVGTQFFLRAEDEGKPRAQASVERIRALNPFARVEVEEGTLADKDAEFFAKFDVVLLVNQPHADEVHANRCCRDTGRSKFIAAHSCGFFATAFVDLLRHEYAVTGRGGSVLSTAPLEVSYLSLEDTTKLRWGELDGQFKYGISPLFMCQQAQREDVCTGDTSAASVAFAALCEERGVPAARVPTDTFLQWRASYGSHLSAVCAIMGGLLGQEVIKVVSGQNRPCDNWLFLDGRTGEALMQRLVVEPKVAAEEPDEADIMSLSDDSDDDAADGGDLTGAD